MRKDKDFLDILVCPMDKEPLELTIEEEMGDVLEQDPFGGLLGGEGGETDAEAGKKGLGRLRRMLPPTHDTELYEM